MARGGIVLSRVRSRRPATWYDARGVVYYRDPLRAADVAGELRRVWPQAHTEHVSGGIRIRREYRGAACWGGSAWIDTPRFSWLRDGITQGVL